MVSVFSGEKGIVHRRGVVGLEAACIVVGIFAPAGGGCLVWLHRDCGNLSVKTLLLFLTPFVLGAAYLLTFQ